jgi:hypothetical protein
VPIVVPTVGALRAGPEVLHDPHPAGIPALNHDSLAGMAAPFHHHHPLALDRSPRIPTHDDPALNGTGPNLDFGPDVLRGGRGSRLHDEQDRQGDCTDATGRHGLPPE